MLPDIRHMPFSPLCLLAAITLYGLAGSPTPDNPGIVELLIAALLVAAIGGGGLMRAISPHESGGPFLRALRILFLCGLFLPLLTGALRGNDPGLMLRDLAAFAFLGLPLFLAARVRAVPEIVLYLALALVGAGCLFALRTLRPAFNIWIPDGELLYLSNSPLTLFAGLGLAGLLWRALHDVPAPRALAQAAVCTAGLAMVLAAMLLDVQRATIGAVLITLILLALHDFIRAPRRTVLPLLLLGVIAAIIFPWLGAALGAMGAKTAEVGMNARLQEARAVYDALHGAPWGLLTGLGWGSVFASPAVAGLEVNYTHSLLTTILLKGGLPLLAAALAMAAAALYEIFLIFQKDSGRGLALLWPFTIPLLLYASHKSLDYGLLLLMIGVWSVRPRALQRESGSVKTKDITQPVP